jgi:hypothetical protein
MISCALVIGPYVLRPDHILRGVEIEPPEDRGGRSVADIHHDLRRLFDDVDGFVAGKIGAVAGPVFVGENDQCIEALVLHFLTEAR